MQASQQVYEDAQYQAAAPIGPQEPIPAGVHDIELSWDRRKGYMRVIIGGKTWHFKEYLGKAQVTGTDSKRGRIYLRAMARIDGETLTPTVTHQHLFTRKFLEKNERHLLTDCVIADSPRNGDCVTSVWIGTTQTLLGLPRIM